jgi:2-dehydro-3-deoxyglucarate aldolase/4-hydroxy-2-oxoheptanedioate aldolase
MAKSFNQRLAAGETVTTFALGRVVHPIFIDMFALAGGYQGFWLDQEHAGIGVDEIRVASVTARANDMDCFVRLAPLGYSQVTQCLEAGAGGVMAAQIHSAAQAEEFVSWAKFAPRGTRGLNAGGRDGDYSYKPAAQFIEDSNRENFVAIQIETLGSIDQVEAIAAIDGVDLLFVGPADLSLCLGVVGQFMHEKLWEAIDKVQAACQKHGKNWGAVVPTPEFADRAAERGCKMPTIGNEIIAVRRGLDAMKLAFDSQF